MGLVGVIKLSKGAQVVPVCGKDGQLLFGGKTKTVFEDHGETARQRAATLVGSGENKAHFRHAVGVAATLLLHTHSLTAGDDHTRPEIDAIGDRLDVASGKEQGDGIAVGIVGHDQGSGVSAAAEAAAAAERARTLLPEGDLELRLSVASSLARIDAAARSDAMAPSSPSPGVS